MNKSNVMKLRLNWFETRGSREIIVHILIWILVLILPLLPNERSNSLTEYLNQLKFPLFFALVFYVNHLFLIQKFFFTKRFAAFVISNLLLYATCVAALESTRPPFPPQNISNSNIRQSPNQVRDANNIPSPPSLPGMIIRLLVSFGLTTGLGVAVQVTKQWFRSENLRKDLEGEHLKSELANLKNQLNPHFLFNTLNNIYSLVNQDQDKAQSAILKLSKLMRYLLYESNERFVSLNKEIQFMHNYIDLMTLRVSNNVSVKYQFPKDVAGHVVAPLLFISLIENSFKHGVSTSNPSAIEMSLEVSNSTVVFKTKNTLFPKDDKDRSGSGIGLENLRKRLALLYPNQHTLEMHTDKMFYNTVLTLPL